MRAWRDMSRELEKRKNHGTNRSTSDDFPTTCCVVAVECRCAPKLVR